MSDPYLKQLLTDIDDPETARLVESVARDYFDQMEAEAGYAPRCETRQQRLRANWRRLYQRDEQTARASLANHFGRARTELDPERDVRAVLGGRLASPLRNHLLAHGKAFAGSPLPPAITRGHPQRCYRNAQQIILCQSLPNATYHEGYALNEHGLPVYHAWLISDGTVADPTWEHPERCAYFGTPVASDDVRRIIGASGIFGPLLPWLVTPARNRKATQRPRIRR